MHTLLAKTVKTTLKTTGTAVTAALVTTTLGTLPAYAVDPALTTLKSFDSVGTLEYGEAATLGNTLLFQGDDGGGAGIELWATDGTAAGTHLVRDLIPGAEGGFPTNLTQYAGKVYFTADTPLQGRELWVTDGTYAGTKVVKDLYPGASSSSPSSMLWSGAKLLFTASSAFGKELWATDGTADGTVQLQDINAVGSSNPAELITVNGTAYFAASEAEHGRELWTTDGTPEGTELVEDLDPGPTGSTPHDLTATGEGVVMFSAAVNNGFELFRSTGSAASTYQVKDINVGPGLSSSPTNLTVHNGKVFFNATTASGRELWSSDGTNVGTVQVKDILPGPGSSDPNNLHTASGVLYFSAAGTGADRELLVSNGSAAGTQRLKDINPGAGASSPQNLFSYLGNVVFSAADAQHGRELWISNGTPQGTALVHDAVAGPTDSKPSPLGSVNLKVVYRTLAGSKVVLRALSIPDLSLMTTAAPVAAGTAKVGRTLSASVAGWTAGTTFTYQWLRGGAAIPGATGSSYKLALADLGKAISVRVQGTKPSHTIGQETSASRTIGLGTQVKQPKPRIVGLALVGKKLTTKPGAHDAGVTLSYQWLRAGKKIAGKAAKKKVYVVKRADGGKRLSVKVTAKKTGYVTVVKVSKKTAVVR